MTPKAVKKLPFILLILTFVIPIVISWYLYHHYTQFHFKTLNYGTLIRPPIPLPSTLGDKIKPNKWQIVYLPSGCFDAQCAKTTFTLHQIHKALGKNYDRVNLLLILHQACTVKPIPDFRIQFFTEQDNNKLQNIFSQKNFTVTDKIYLVDPLGNLFMYYPSNTNPMHLLKDIEKVLEVSQIG